MWDLILISAAAGVLGTGMGALLGTTVFQRSEKVLGALLAFAGGTMVGLVCFELVHEAAEASSVWFAALALFTGMTLVWLLNLVLGDCPAHEHHFCDGHCEDEDAHAPKGMLRAGWFMLFAITLHNLPEGLALGATGELTTQLALALMIALHNLPDGMAIGASLRMGGMKKSLCVLLPALTGLATLLGAVAGRLLGELSPLLTAFMLGLAGGTLLFVTFGEILPRSRELAPGSRLYTPLVLLGVLAGLLLTAAH